MSHEMTMGFAEGEDCYRAMMQNTEERVEFEKWLDGLDREVKLRELDEMESGIYDDREGDEGDMLDDREGDELTVEDMYYNNEAKCFVKKGGFC